MKKWIASAIVISMTMNHCPLCSDGAPDITPDVPIEAAVLQEPSLLEQRLADLPIAEATEIPSEAIETAPATDEEQSAPEEPSLEEENVAEVGKASEEGSKTSSNRTWQRVAIAGAAVIVAAIAIILVSLNEGHHSN